MSDKCPEAPHESVEGWCRHCGKDLMGDGMPFPRVAAADVLARHEDNPGKVTPAKHTLANRSHVSFPDCGCFPNHQRETLRLPCPCECHHENRPNGDNDEAVSKSSNLARP